MSKINKIKALAVAFAVLFLMNSCADFFSTSWGEMFKRDPKKVKVTTSNVYDLLDTAKGDPELSREILNKINADSPDTLKLAAIKAANQAAGISTVALENIKDLINAVDSSDKETALRDVAKNIQNDLAGKDIVGIADKMVEILVDKVNTSPVAPKTALINTGEITVSARTSDDGSTGVIINVDSNGTGTVTIRAPDGTVTPYNCEINDDGTITLIGAGQYGGNAVIGYEIDNKDRTLTLTGLDRIKNIELDERSSPSNKEETGPIATGKPEFENGFADSVPESDLTLLAMTLILAKAEKIRDKKDLNSYFNDWPAKDLRTGKGLDDEELLIAAIINEMIDRGELTSDENELTKMLKELLGVK
jgi:hypothetical protein